MNLLKELYFKSKGTYPNHIEPLSGAGSNRKYYRIIPSKNSEPSCIGVVGTSAEENLAFCHLSQLFISKHLPVPAVWVVSDDGMRYIQDDLGDTSLYKLLEDGRKNGGNYSDEEKTLIKQVISDLPRLQMEMAYKEVYQHCYPVQMMDGNSVMFDLNYFKYCYLKLVGIEFNEQQLQIDFDNLREHLLSVKECGFQYRDFQARNVMVKDGVPYYIDFQGGRFGPIYYDLASFLWQASSNFNKELRNEMINVYIESYKAYNDIDTDYFKKQLSLFVLFRTLQVLGAYGFRGLWEKKKHFIDSIPLALQNLSELIVQGVCNDYSYLKQICLQLVASDSNSVTSKTVEGAKNSLAQELLKNDKGYCKKTDKKLVVRVFSFSYKKGIPEDESGNGGGYVFDCRSTHNPGRYEQYKQITGLDKPVIDFLEDDGEIVQFLDSVYKLADFHVRRFMERGFTDLMFSFGCTGGQHRSVYSAQHLAERLNRKFGVEVRIFHREQNISQVLEARPVN